MSKQDLLAGISATKKAIERAERLRKAMSSWMHVVHVDLLEVQLNAMQKVQRERTQLAWDVHLGGVNRREYQGDVADGSRPIPSASAVLRWALLEGGAPIS